MPPECKSCGHQAFMDDFAGHKEGCKVPFYYWMFRFMVREYEKLP